jgi:hypothetical protein
VSEVTFCSLTSPVASAPEPPFASQYTVPASALRQGDAGDRRVSRWENIAAIDLNAFAELDRNLPDQLFEMCFALEQWQFCADRSR